MGEAIIARGETVDPKLVARYEEVLKTEIITENTVWEVPGNALIEKGIAVRIFGGGGSISGAFGYTDMAWCMYGGGGGGWMNNEIFTNLNKFDKIIITIGDGGNNANSSKSGGITTFGGYLSANGGSVANYSNGGDGGAGGGGGIGMGGTGYQFGGGGGAGRNKQSVYYTNYFKGGNGGKWGGGGGSTFDFGSGGQYGNSGGNLTVKALNGTNISNRQNNVFDDLQITEVDGLGGGFAGGGGGYGGCGGKAGTILWIGGGGGGGFAANGGTPLMTPLYHTPSGSTTNFCYSAGGGGGGYGGKGADGTSHSGGGGGGYGPSNYGAGGGGNAINGYCGKSGICIIHYYAKELV